MTKEKLDHYNADYTYKKEQISIDKSHNQGYPKTEAVYNAALFPESIKDSIDMQQLKPYH